MTTSALSSAPPASLRASPPRSPAEIVTALLRGGGATPFVARLFEIALRPTPPARFGAFAYAGSADLAWAVLRERDVLQKKYGALELLGLSRFSTNGEDWASRRAMTQPSFAAAGRQSNGPRAEAVFEVELAKAEPGVAGLVNALSQASSAIFFSAIGVDGLSEDPTILLSRARMVAGAIQRAALYGANAQTLQGLAAAAEALRAHSRRLCEENPQLGAFCETMRERGGVGADFDAPTELLFGFFAGVETTISTFVWAIDRLGAMPQTQKALAEEAAGPLPHPMLGAFIDETMRCYPPLPFVTRIASEAIELEGLRLAKGDELVVSIIGVHRDPSRWREPHRFDPLRSEFLDGSFDKRSYMPFSAGERICGGLTMARLELSRGLAAMLRRLTITRPDAATGLDFALTLRPVLPKGMTVARRA